jgi:hypothetical protein
MRPLSKFIAIILEVISELGYMDSDDVSEPSNNAESVVSPNKGISIGINSVTYKTSNSSHDINLDSLTLKHAGFVIRHPTSREILAEIYNCYDNKIPDDYPLKETLKFSTREVFSFLVMHTFNSDSFDNFLLGLSDCFVFVYVKFIYIQKCEYFWRYMYGYGLIFHIWNKRKLSDESEF